MKRVEESEHIEFFPSIQAMKRVEESEQKEFDVDAFLATIPDHQSNKSSSARAVSQIRCLVLSDMKMAVNEAITAAL